MRAPFRMAAMTAAAVGMIGVPLAAHAQCSDGRPGTAPCGAQTRPDTNTYLVLPFKVSGPESVGYLGESMVDLLDMALNGVAGMKIQSAPNTLRRVNALPSQDARAGRGTALEWGAGRIVAGTVVAIGNDVRIRAEVYDAVRDRSLYTVDARSHPDRVTFAIDTLATAILARRLVSGWQRNLLNRGEFASGSPGALRAYLVGRQLFLRNQRREAAESVKVALRLDPDFGPAHLLLYRLEAAAGGTTGIAVPTIVGNAMQHVDRFPERVQALMRSYEVALRAEREKTGANVAALAQRYPEDAEVAWRVADHAFHEGRNMGESQASVIAKFRRALAIDDQDPELLNHFMAILAEAGDTLGYVAICRAIAGCEIDPAFKVAYRGASPNSFAAGKDSLWWGGPTMFPVRMIPDPILAVAIADDFATLQTAPNRGRQLRANAFLARAIIALTRGAYESAWVHLDSAGAAGRPSPPYRLLANIVTDTHASAGDFERVNTNNFLALQARAWWAAVRLPFDSAETVLTDLERRPPQDSTVVAAVVSGLRGILALRRGDTTRARELLLRTRAFHSRRTVQDRLLQPGAWLALVLAQVELAIGSPAKAHLYLADLYPTNETMPFLGDVEETRAKIALALADTATAKKSLGIVIRLWEGGDAAVQPRVAAARATLARLERGH